MSAIEREIVRQKADLAATPAGAFAGTVSKGATDMGERIMVVVPAINPTLAIGPCRWQARDDTSHPARGDSCLVVFDDNDEAWVAAWWPFST